MRPTTHSSFRCVLAVAEAILAILLASATSVLAAEPPVRGTDPIGDTTADGPDIVAVETTITPDDEILVAIELAEPLEASDTLVLWIDVDGDDLVSCIGWFSEAMIDVTVDGAFISSPTPGVGIHTREIDVAFDGELVSMRFPLAAAEASDTLTLSVRARVGEDLDESDAYPDPVDEMPVCHVAMSPGGGSAPDTAMGFRSGLPASVGWVGIGTGGLALLLAASMVASRVGDHDS